MRSSKSHVCYLSEVSGRSVRRYLEKSYPRFEWSFINWPEVTILRVLTEFRDKYIYFSKNIVDTLLMNYVEDFIFL